MNYPEIFHTVSFDIINDGEVEMPHMGGVVGVALDDEDGTVMLTIHGQWFCRRDLLELASILCRIAATMEPEEEAEEDEE